MDRSEEVRGTDEVGDGEVEEDRLGVADVVGEGADLGVVVVRTGDGLLEDGRVAGEPGHREVADVAVEGARVEEAPGDVVEPDALTDLTKTTGDVRGSFHGDLFFTSGVNWQWGSGDGAGGQRRDGARPARKRRRNSVPPPDSARLWGCYRPARPFGVSEGGQRDPTGANGGEGGRAANYALSRPPHPTDAWVFGRSPVRAPGASRALPRRQAPPRQPFRHRPEGSRPDERLPP
jgi:hypothetical protein